MYWLWGLGIYGGRIYWAKAFIFVAKVVRSRCWRLRWQVASQGRGVVLAGVWVQVLCSSVSVLFEQVKVMGSIREGLCTRSGWEVNWSVSMVGVGRRRWRALGVQRVV